MIITLSGITGVGKSFFKKQIVTKLGFENMVIVTNREKRFGEINGIDKYFVTDEEFEKMKKEKEVLADFEFLGNKYAYKTKDVLSNKNHVTEMHYEYIENLKKCSEDVLAIYIIPNNFQRAIQELKKRKLKKHVEETRIQEMINQKDIFEKSQFIQNQFDIIFTNNYTKESVDDFIKIIQERIKKCEEN